MKMGKRFTASLALVLAMFMAFTDVASAFDGVDVSTSDEVYEESFEIFEESSKMAVGSDGVQYDAAYISEAAFARLSDDAKAAYVTGCNEIAEMFSMEAAPANVAMGCDENGYVYGTMTVDLNEFHGFMPEATDELLGGLSELSESDVSTGDFEASPDISSNDSDVSANDEENSWEDVSNNDEILDSAGDVSASETQDEDVSAQEVTESDLGFISENMDYFVDFDNPGETDEEIALYAEEYDTLISWFKSNYFTKQLNKDALNIYNKAKSTLTGGKTSFSFSSSYVLSSDIWTGISTAILCYPYQTSWVSGSFSYSWRYVGGGKYQYNISTSKSKYYSSKIHKEAKAQVNDLVNKAISQSGVTDPTYAIANYFDDWICANNYYDTPRGASSNSKSLYPKEYYYNHSPYGTLLYGYGVCESYAKTMTWLLDTAGITNIYAVSNDHAYVYVEMPNKEWYMLDSTWNDTDSKTHNYSTKEYFLSKGDTNVHHRSNGKYFSVGKSLNFPTLSSYNYTKNSAADVTLNKTVWTTTKGKTTTLKIKESYYSKFKKTWSSSNTSVVTVSSKGKVTAKAPGNATISCTVGGKTVKCTVYVYELSGITFSATGTSKHSYTFADNDQNLANNFNSYTLTINHKASCGLNAQQLMNYNSALKLTASSSNKKVATVEASLSGNSITLKVTPKKYGDTKITVKFAGKTATMTYKVRESMQNGWFNDLTSEQKTVVYSGKAYTPKITKNTANTTLPKKLTYKVIYTNNKNAGTATVTIRGTGNYTGDLTKTFKINPYTVTDDNLKYSVPTNKSYTGKNMLPKVTVKVKMGKKWVTLKKDKDYTLSLTTAVNAANYDEYLTLIGNYTAGKKFHQYYTIAKVPFKKLSVSVPSSMKYKGTNLTPTIKVKYDKNVLPATDYTVKYYLKDANGKYYEVGAPNAKGTYKVEITMVKGKNVEPSYEKSGAEKPMVFTKTLKVVK